MLNKILFFAIDICICLLLRKKHTGTIAIVKIDNIGDFLIWKDAFSSLILNYQNAVLVCNERVVDLLPYGINFIPVNVNKLNNNFLYRIKFLSYIRKQGFCEIIQPTFFRGVVAGDSIVRTSGAAKKVGVALKKSFIASMVDLLTYSNLIKIDSLIKNQQQFNIEFNKKLGIEDQGILNLNSSFFDLGFKGDYVVFMIGATSTYRRWGIDKYIALAEAILKKNPDLKIVVCGDEMDKIYCDQIKLSLGKAVVDLCGKTSLPQLLHIVKLSKFLIGNESAGVHMAAMIQKKSICILGGGHFGYFLPYKGNSKNKPICVINKIECFNCNWSCDKSVNGTVPCVSEISVDSVLTAVESIYE